MRGFIKGLCICLVSACLLGAGVAASGAEEPKREVPPLTILFTHDTHDHFLPEPAENGGEYGGYTRLSTLLNRERRAAGADRAVVTLDAGDFSMGSLFQTIYSTDAPELRALGAMGYDAVTLGNHEFDYRAAGLADMLDAAVDSGDPLPQIVLANYRPPEGDQRSRRAWERAGIRDYVILERAAEKGASTLRIAVFGLMGVDADACAPMSGMEFTPMVEAAERVVKEIREKEHPDYIICLSHAGTTDGKGEDYELAKKVDGIDVIISGHTHTTFEEPIEVNNTVIVCCGEYTQNLGVLAVDRSGKKGSVACLDYRLLPVDETVPEDPRLTAMANRFRGKVDRQYLSGYGLTFDQVVARSSFSFTPIRRFAAEQEEDPLGSLIADSYVYAVQQAEGRDYVPVDFAVVASGVVRASLSRGDITTSDVFNVSSLGFGADGKPGYPLVSAWLTGRELRDAFEVDASVTPLMTAAQLYPAGMTWTYNPHRMIFDKVTDCAQVLPDGTRVPLENDRLYRVVTGLYSAQMLGAVNDKSFGILKITPKDAQGNEITDFEQHIIHNQNGSEVKEWYALASYLKHMGTVDSRYSAPEGRKVSAPSWNPIQLLKHPGKLTILALVIVLALITAVMLIIRYILGGGRRGRYSKRYGTGYRPYRG